MTLVLPAPGFSGTDEGTVPDLALAVRGKPMAPARQS
jgi:hypothetical protein